jgi:hypothetical protein
VALFRVYLFPSVDQIFMDVGCRLAGGFGLVEVGADGEAFFSIGRGFGIVIEVGVEMDLAEGAGQLVIMPSLLAGSVTDADGIV